MRILHLIPDRCLTKAAAEGLRGTERQINQVGRSWLAHGVLCILQYIAVRDLVSRRQISAANGIRYKYLHIGHDLGTN